MTLSYKDANISLRNHRLSYFDLGKALHPTIEVITGETGISFQVRELAARTVSIANLSSQPTIQLTTHEDSLTGVFLTALSLVEDERLIGTHSASIYESNLTPFGKGLLTHLTAIKRIQPHDKSRSTCESVYQIHWVHANRKSSIEEAVADLTSSPRRFGCIFILDFARAKNPNLTFYARDNPIHTIENATGLGEIYFT